MTSEETQVRAFSAPPNPDAAYHASLWEPPILRDRHGKEIRLPKKAQGLLALLLTSESGTRTRGWLEAKLWSNRPQEQARGSLRQLLSTIRKSCPDLIDSHHQNVWLNAEAVNIVDGKRGRKGGFKTLFEGVDAMDPEFEYWLTLERSAHESKVSNEFERSDAVEKNRVISGENDISHDLHEAAQALKTYHILYNIGRAKQLSFKKSGDLRDLESAIEALNRAVLDAVKEGALQTEIAALQNSLAGVFMDKAYETDDKGALAVAVSLLETALERKTGKSVVPDTQHSKSFTP